MTVEEMFRRIVRAHAAVIVLCVLAALATVGVLQAHSVRMWSGVVRIQVDSTAPGSTTQADATNSRVLALATTPRLITRALRIADLRRDPAEVAKHAVSVQRLGEAPIVEVQVDDRSRAGAGRLVSALAREVAAFMNEASTQHAMRVVADLNIQVAKAQDKQGALVNQMSRTFGKRPRDNVRLQLLVATQYLNQLRSQRNTLVLADAQRDPVVVIDAAHPSVTQQPSTLPARLVLGGLLGLVLGLVMAVAIEAVRPRLAGPRALARRLDAPVLGSMAMRPAALANAVTLTARRQGVETVVVVGVEAKDEQAVDRLLQSLSASTEPAPDKAPHKQAAKVPGNAPRPRGRDDKDDLDPDLSQTLGMRFTGLSSVRPEDEHTAGVLVVTPGNAPYSRVEALEDLLKAMRWPVVGIVVSSRRLQGGSAA